MNLLKRIGNWMKKFFADISETEEEVARLTNCTGPDCKWCESFRQDEITQTLAREAREETEAARPRRKRTAAPQEPTRGKAAGPKKTPARKKTTTKKVTAKKSPAKVTQTRRKR